MNRREFLKVLAVAAATAPFASGKPFPDALGPVLPMRPLGRNLSVTCLGLGGYHIG